ncbi:MAG TPA: hypothetical protein DCZ95_02810 [Verrucomicrobia bacterium]|nr:MAG: hypothetical protein A2X46_14875 [Lentisphaerae bacterium GWF2_57_35]HBA83003.1 hypothetical protein [Verrucomicrobiota bacterium]
MNPANHKRRQILRRDGESGQALVEACLGAALLVLVWALAIYSTFMASNYIRTAMAARHAAWMRGNGGSPDAAAMEGGFFFQAGLVKVEEIEAIGLDGLFSGDSDQNTLANAGEGPFRYKVTFGIDDVAHAATYPFVLMKTKLPYMPETKLYSFLSVSSVCQWDEVNNAWTSWIDALEGIWDAIVDNLF